MLCRVCKVDKLSKEFVPFPITKQCEHPHLVCLRCATKSASQNGKCPYEDCGQPVSANSAEIQEFETILSYMFKEIEATDDDIADAVDLGPSSSIFVTMLTGDRYTIPFDPTLTVSSLRRKITQVTKVAENKQRLLYNEQELKDIHNNKEAQLKDFKMKPNCTVYLMVLLYEIPSTFNHVTFDLFWGYPASGCDYLDASCLIYDKLTFLSHADFNNCSSMGAIHHSGDVMDHQNSKGHHTIQVYLKQIPADVTHLFFTLSAWSSPTIAHYPNPSLRFFEASNPTKDLCKTTFTHARHSQAVIMCSVSRVGNQWSIFESGQLSSGNAADYKPLKQTISTLITSGV